MFDKDKEKERFGLYFSVDSERWGFAEKTINNVDIETGEVGIPAYFKVETEITGAPDQTAVVAIVEAPTISDAWQAVGNRFSVQKVFWVANLERTCTAKQFEGMVMNALVGKEPRTTDPMELF